MSFIGPTLVIPLLGLYFKKWVLLSIKRYVHSSFIHNIQNIETIQMSVNRDAMDWMLKP